MNGNQRRTQRSNYPLDLGAPSLNRRAKWERASRREGFASLAAWVRFHCDRQADSYKPKRRPLHTFHHKSDERVLKYASAMGHEFAGVAHYKGINNRELICETNSIEAARESFASYHLDPAIYRNVGDRWELVEVVDRTVDLRTFALRMDK